MKENWEDQRNRIIGLGEDSFKKSYYPDLQSKIEELEYANLNLKTVFDSTNDGIIIHDSKGSIQFLNNQAMKLFNIMEDEIGKYTVKDISATSMDQTILDCIWDEVFKGNPKTIEWTIKQLHTGIETNTQVSINSAIWYGNKVIVAVIRDFTERLRYEQELYKAKNRAEQSDRLKTVFLNNMSHEIRTPMNGIMGFSEMLQNPGISQEQQRNYIRIVQNSCQQLLRIIDDILEISTLETNQVKALTEKVCLNNLMLDLFSIFNLKTSSGQVSLFLKNDLSDEQSTIFTDPVKLHKILSNLIENALKFTYEGFVEFGYKLKGNNLVIYVKDTGIGISQQSQEHIFNRFSQEELEISKNRGGLGLGLSIAKENANLIGATISLDSEKGKGSVFYLTMDYNPVFGNTFQTEDGLKEGNGFSAYPASNTILIAEDEEINYLYIEALLMNDKKVSYRILHAKNGIEAIELFKENPDIRIILMDLKMPLMHGYDAAVEILKIKPDIPIIAQTAYSTSYDREKALSAGFYDFISKPLDRIHFFKIVYQALGIGEE